MHFELVSNWSICRKFVTHGLALSPRLGAADAGQTSTVTLTATAPAVAGPPTDSDDHVVTIIAPALTVTKTVHASEADALAAF